MDSRNILELLDMRASENGSEPAVSDGNCALTWKQLCTSAKAYAAYLCKKVPAGKPIGVCAERRSETLILFFAVLYAGCYYVPLDPESPKARLCEIQKSAGFSLTLFSDTPPEKWALDGEKEIYRKSLPLPSAQECSVLDERRKAITARSPLYLIYTSGSTGIPKGIVKQYGAMQSFAEAFLSEYPIMSQDVIGNQTPFYFDASAKDIYWTLYSGCHLEILPTKLFSFPVELVRRMNETGVTVISWVPSALSIVSQLGTFASIVPEKLRLIFFVGEVFSVKQLLRWRSALPQATYVNLYGSSEIAGVACHYRVEGDYEPGEVLPIGYALPNCTVYLRDEAGKPISASGQEGELCIASASLAAEYVGDAARTEKVFSPEVLPDGRTVRVLHTGDMAMRNAQGAFVFTSRRDFQIKHMGYRIELGEIEAAVSALPEMEQCACIHDPVRDRIFLFAQPAVSAWALTAAELMTQLRGCLCSYMIPQRIFILEALPHNQNGKIDRESLKRTYLPASKNTLSSKL